MLEIENIKHPKTIYRSDYKEYPFNIKKIDLQIDLDIDCTVVTNIMQIERKNSFKKERNIIFNIDSKEVDLVQIEIDGKKLCEEDYILNNNLLLMKNIPDVFNLQITTKCFPSKNSSMMGLYISNNNFFTQCEPEGFRKITCFPDRPDVMSKYTVTLRSDKKYSTLLSNGNLIKKNILDDGRHEFIWDDPFPKPSYLFALVGGNFSCREKNIKTNKGRDVKLQIYCDHEFDSKTEWAMYSLIKAIEWDEKKYNLELDLDRFMIVAVKDFNMGAMENKGLNIFNIAYVIADQYSSTDSDYENVMAVIGHEYFHNWTGNRVTCRDWFQLSLKEGLTVFREQEFCSDIISELASTNKIKTSVKALKRIDDVIALRTYQFPEDSSSNAHPIRPNSYQEISNFYTTTIYEKGAEIIRMQHTLLGEKNFLAGMSKYFELYDGKAVTCDDFVNVMESIYIEKNINNECKDFTVFKNWYEQAGTPIVNVTLDYDKKNELCIITLSQKCDFVGIEKNTKNFFKEKKIFHIPFAIGLLDENGESIDLICNEKNIINTNNSSNTMILELYKESQSWTFKNIKNIPIPSLLRNFSSPVKVEYQYSNKELYILSNKDTDYFARWEAIQELSTRQIISKLYPNKELSSEIEENLITIFKNILLDNDIDSSYCAKLLTIPDEKIIFGRVEKIDPIEIYKARRSLLTNIGKKLSQYFYNKLDKLENLISSNSKMYDPIISNNRFLKNLIIKYLISANATVIEDKVEKDFYNSNNMTDSLSLLSDLLNFGNNLKAKKALSYFYDKWKSNPLVIDKWFALQASSERTTINEIKELMNHQDFTIINPNRARSLIFQFCFRNYLGMHNLNGLGYQFWAEQVIAIDAINPEIAARLSRALDNWNLFIPEIKDKMYEALIKVYKHQNLSKNTFEIISKNLNIL
ncbi:aminopeptidase N [Candidatus Kinetoplastibacterium desouzaii TCC079E]|uniref:Aminopeptidase N n=1 Tax=Candidatus Kinetoplastidibacterium desouzai TCC079E TaxID=1208919 RepID=M1L2E4_9PROT|nr:aminopeptidase N [Candidatus Kinetoplastibacterium desouzaii]AGF46918.1 aminopeptidase N [Candidatus Kinetoplastibacterium desouzaii TCC079E]